MEDKINRDKKIKESLDILYDDYDNFEEEEDYEMDKDRLLFEEEMNNYCEKLDFIYTLINNIKEYTDYYVLPIAKNLEPKHIEQFLEHLKFK